jgi:type VI protein secretion system component VasA
MRIEKELRDVTPERIASYVHGIESAGDVERNGVRTLRGTGWTISLTALEPVRVGTIDMERVSFSLDGDDEIANRLWERLFPALMRGGA